MEQYLNYILFIKNQNILPTIVRYGDIPKMCKLLILGNLVLSGYAHPRWQLVENLMFLSMPKNKLHHTLLPLAHNPRIRIL